MAPQTSNLYERLCVLAGEDVASQLCNEFGGQMIYLPFHCWLPQKTVAAINQAFTGQNHTELARRFRVTTNVIYYAVQQYQKQQIEQSLQAHREGGESDGAVRWVIPVTQPALPQLLEAVLLAVKTATAQGNAPQFHIALVSRHSALPADVPVRTPQYGSAESRSDSSAHPDNQPAPE